MVGQRILDPYIPRSNRGEGTMIYFIADLHFYHARIIGLCSRPFQSVVEMNEALVSNWNDVVTDNDIVWVLGDLSLTKNRQLVEPLVRRLKGRKRLVLGNHDKMKTHAYEAMGFEFVSPYPVVFRGYTLSHEPTHLPMNIFGHVHNTEVEMHSTSVCVSVERTGYKPIAVEGINEDANRSRAIGRRDLAKLQMERTGHTSLQENRSASTYDREEHIQSGSQSANGDIGA